MRRVSFHLEVLFESVVGVRREQLPTALRVQMGLCTVRALRAQACVSMADIGKKRALTLFRRDGGSFGHQLTYLQLSS